VRALGHLRLFFGERVETVPPPGLERLLNFAPWTGEWLAWLARSITTVEGAAGYASLRERLIDPARFDEACSMLQIADRLATAGLDVGFDQAVSVDGARKVPDLSVRDLAANVEFHCEISESVERYRSLKALTLPLLRTRVS
jgi:hypothetical protein